MELEKRHMEKFNRKKMKRIYFIIVFLTPVFLFSQNKTIVPQKGTIVFSSKATITDFNLYMSSLEEFMGSFNKAMELDQEDSSPKAKTSPKRV